MCLFCNLILTLVVEREENTYYVPDSILVAITIHLYVFFVFTTYLRTIFDLYYMKEAVLIHIGTM